MSVPHTCFKVGGARRGEWQFGYTRLRIHPPAFVLEVRFVFYWGGGGGGRRRLRGGGGGVRGGGRDGGRVVRDSGKEGDDMVGNLFSLMFYLLHQYFCGRHKQIEGNYARTLSTQNTQTTRGST